MTRPTETIDNLRTFRAFRDSVFTDIERRRKRRAIIMVLVGLLLLVCSVTVGGW